MFDFMPGVHRDEDRSIEGVEGGFINAKSTLWLINMGFRVIRELGNILYWDSKGMILPLYALGTCTYGHYQGHLEVPKYQVSTILQLAPKP